MKRRFFSILTALALCLTLLPSAALAEEPPATAAQPSAAEVTGVPQTRETPQPDAAVSALQSRLDALPTPDSLASADEAEIAAAYQAAQDAYDALEALDPGQLAQITGLEKLVALMDWFNGQVTPLDSEPVKLSYKTSGNAAAATETFSNLMSALDKVGNLSGASEIEITVSDSHCWSDDSSSGDGGNYEFPTGKYTITFEKDKLDSALFYFCNKNVNTRVDLVIPSDADVTLKSSKATYLDCNSVTVKGTLSLDYTRIRYSKNDDTGKNYAPVTINGGAVILLTNGEIYGNVTLTNGGSLTQKNFYANLFLMGGQTPLPSLTVSDGTVTLDQANAYIYRKVILDGPNAKLDLKSGYCGSDKCSDDSISCSAGQLNVSGATVDCDVTISDSGYASISGGSFSGSVTLSGAADHKTTVSGGTFTQSVTLNSAGNIQLSGGTFQQGLTIADSVTEKHLSDYLSPGHVFKKGDTLVPYSTASSTTATSATTWPNSGAVTVVECSHSGFESGLCDYCNATIVASVTANNSVSYYESWSEALAYARSNSDSTLKLLAAINTPNSLTVSTSFTLDLSAQQMTVGHLTVNENAALTVQGSNPFTVSSSEGGDGKAEINGTLKLSSGADLSAVDITVNSSGTMTVSGSAAIGGKVDSSGTMTVSGGTFKNAVNIKGGTATISGGTFQAKFKVYFEPGNDPTVSVSGGVFEEGVDGTLNKVLAVGYGFRRLSTTSAEWFGYEDNREGIFVKVEAKAFPIQSVTLSYSPGSPVVFSQVTLAANCVLDETYRGQTPTFDWRADGGTPIGSEQSAVVTPQQCTNPSRYHCTVTLDGYSKLETIRFTAGKANIPDHYVTAPTAATGLIYNGDMQPLLSAAGAFNNTNTSLFALNYQMQYRLGADGDWTTDFSDIQASEAGTYYVYYGVKIIGQTSYNDYVCPDPLAVTIAPPPSPPISDDTDPTYSITLTDSEHGSVSLTIPRAYAWPGDTVSLNIAPDSGYALETLTVTTRSGKEVDVTVRGDRATFKMPDNPVTVSATFMEDNSMLNFFTDVFPGDYYYDAVLWAAENGITGGVDDLRFAPGQPCTRAQIVTFLYRWAVALGLDVSGGEDTNILSYTDAFDIPEYAIPAFQWAISAGILQGNDGTLTPNGGCTRAQAVTFLFRFAAAYGMDFVTMQELVSGFGDAAQVPGYALSAMNWALAHGIVNGNNGDLSPNAPCTRAQIVTFLYRMSH